MENEELLERTYTLVKANNSMLKSMRRSAFFGFLFKILFWVVVLGLPAWLYFSFLQPIIDNGSAKIEKIQQLVKMLNIDVDASKMNDITSIINNVIKQ